MQMGCGMNLREGKGCGLRAEETAGRYCESRTPAG
jgi:hypothetical protein